MQLSLIPIWGMIILIGLPTLIPLAFGAWIYGVGKGGGYPIDRLLMLSVLGVCASVGVVWALVELTRNSASINLPAYGAALLVGAASLGILAAHAWSRPRRIARLIVVLMVFVFLFVAGFLNVIVWLSMAGVH